MTIQGSRFTIHASGNARAQARARARWTALAGRFRTVTPEAVGRGFLTVLSSVLIVGLIVASWPAILPFAVGVVLAYAVLPIANRLDRFMPRFVAALVAELVALGVLVGVVLLIIPPLLNGIVQVTSRLPTPDQIRAFLLDLQAQIGDLPEPVRSIALGVATSTVANFQAVASSFVDSMATVVTQAILGIAGTVSFVLGLLVVPVWVLTVVADERGIRERGKRLIAPAIRPDVIAVVRIVDRAFATFLRIRVLLAIVVGVLVWLGLVAARELDIAPFPYAVTGGALLGVLQLIPELGFFLGFFPILLVLAISGPIPALTVVVVYVAAARIASGLVETRVSRGVLDVHPGLLVPAIVVLSQFGVWWLLVAAPIVAILRDTIRYLAGRLAEPPMPAGVLPGERAQRSTGAMVAAVPIPSVYRNARAQPATAGAVASARVPSSGRPAASLPLTGPPATAGPTVAPASQRRALP